MDYKVTTSSCTVLQTGGINSIYVEVLEKNGNLKITVENCEYNWSAPHRCSIETTPNFARNLRDLLNDYLKD